MPFKHVSQIVGLEDYKKGIKQDLAKVKESGEPFHYLDKFEFTDKQGKPVKGQSLLLVGNIPSGLLSEVKAHGSGYAHGTCSVKNDAVVFDVQQGKVDQSKVAKVVATSLAGKVVRVAAPGTVAPTPTPSKPLIEDNYVDVSKMAELKAKNDKESSEKESESEQPSPTASESTTSASYIDSPLFNEEKRVEGEQEEGQHTSEEPSSTASESITSATYLDPGIFIKKRRQQEKEEESSEAETTEPSIFDDVKDSPAPLIYAPEFKGGSQAVEEEAAEEELSSDWSSDISSASIDSSSDDDSHSSWDNKRPRNVSKEYATRIKRLVFRKDPKDTTDPIVASLVAAKAESEKQLTALMADPDVDEKTLEPVVAELERTVQTLDGRLKVRSNVSPEALDPSKQSDEEKAQRAKRSEEALEERKEKKAAFENLPMGKVESNWEADNRKLRKLFEKTQANREAAQDEVDARAKEFQDLRKKPDARPEEIKAAADGLDAAVQKLETAQKLVGKAFTGLEKHLAVVPASLGEEYAQETEQLGTFRRDALNRNPAPGKREDYPNEEEWQKAVAKFLEGAKSGMSVTYHFTDEDRKKRELNVGADNKVTSGQQGDNLANLKRGYVADPETQKVYQFHDQESRIVGQTENPHTKEQVDQYGQNFHSSVLGGKDALGAGQMKFDQDGKIAMVSNASGHYKPSVVQLIATVELLVKQGFLLDRSYLMNDPATNQGVPLTGKVLTLHESTLKVEARVRPQLERCKELKAAIDAKQARGENFDAEMAELEQLDEKLKPDLANIDKSRQLLGKLGAGPANKFTGAKVAAIDGTAGMRGKQIHDAEQLAEQNAKGVADFLATGGGAHISDGKVVSADEKKQAKKTVQEELLEKTASKKRALDQEAEARAERVDQYFSKLDKEVLPNLKKKLAKVSGFAWPGAKKAAEDLQRLITSMETQIAARQAPSDADLDAAIRKLDASDAALDTAFQELESEEGGANSETSENVLKYIGDLAEAFD